MNTHSNPQMKAVTWPYRPGQYLLGPISREEVMTYSTPGKPWTILDDKRTRHKAAHMGGMR